MKKLTVFMDEKPLTSFAIVAAFFLLIGMLIFLFTKDNAANPHSITGIQALGQQGLSFWLWAIVFTALASAVAIWAFKRFATEDSSSFGNFWIIFGIFLAIAWGKGCTDKATDGVTSSKGRPVPVQIDTTRKAAEDFNK
jgi:hypothetical protein